MSFSDNLKNKYFAIIDFILLLIFGVIHLVFYFIIKETDFENIFDTFESSPLFDLKLSANCGSYSHIIFHVWEGYEVSTRGRNSNSRTKIVDRTDIDRINGNYFCYKKISYKDLLYKGQIIKKGESCPQEYNTNCGIIDTLEQQLCIKNGESCPLYDIGIGNKPLGDYTHQNGNNANIYYNNNNNYNEANKKIIGKLILNEGQPCYRLGEKLWRKFVSIEAGDNHLECELKVFDKLNDDKYNKRGEITYQKIYQDNLENSIYNTLFKDVMDKLNNEKVSLYKREFLGIDKTCDEENKIDRNNYETLRNNQKNEGICILFEGIIILCFWLVLIISILILKCKGKLGEHVYNILFLFLNFILLLNLICLICQSVFLGKIIKNDLAYDCSDEITNEVLRLENLNTKKTIIYSGINLGADVLYILFNVLFFLIVYIKEKCENYKYNLRYANKDKETNIDFNNNAQNQFKIDSLNKGPIREVEVKNGNQNIYEKPVNNFNDNNYITNNIQNINDKDENMAPTADLGVPPFNAPGFSSDSKL